MSSALERWAESLFEGLVASGIRDVVLSPGSRSTPWVLAASLRPELRIVDVIDERSAAFFALGQARATGRPSLLLCTSGTAPAHYLPAVIEASESNLPLVILSADRPLDRLDCGAPQVTDQIKLYGDHVRHFCELGEPREGARDLRSVLARAVLAVSRSRWPRPGPVHINARARKPLEPETLGALTSEGAQSATQAQGGVKGRGGGSGAALRRNATFEVMLPISLPSAEAVSSVWSALARARRPLLVAGPAPLSQVEARGSVLAFARRYGLPLLADPTSQLLSVEGICEGAGEGAREAQHDSKVVLDAGAALLESAVFRRRFRPDLVIQLGAAPISTAWERWLSELDGSSHIVVGEHTLHDPLHTADLFVVADIGELCRRLLDKLDSTSGTRTPSARDAEWLASLAAANVCARSVSLEIADGASPGLSEAAIARLAVSSLPRGALLAVGNSLPVRWLGLFGGFGNASARRQAPEKGDGPAAPILVWSQRGVNGIDGLISGVAGSAHALLWRSAGQLSGELTSSDRLSSEPLASEPLPSELAPSERPVATVLLLGDLSFQHDLGGLATLALLPPDHPFVIVVVHNGGGRIFEQLPIAASGVANSSEDGSGNDLSGQLKLGHWTTPHDRSFEGVASTFGVAYRRVEAHADFETALASFLERGRPTILEARVPQSGAREEISELRRRLDIALEDLPVAPKSATGSHR